MLLSAAICFAGALAGGAALALLYERHVVQEPGDHLGRDHIRAILVEESPVFYRDGRTRVGVFFADEHRAWIGWEELPRPWVIGIVAAEDGRFWRHPGLDPKHVARAMRDNFRAGTVVAGGSTLTQQTAKNLYYRPDRSMRAKGIELLNALRLEAHYDKTEILTFYANQFHVAGNGRGLAIAARYFFDQDPSEIGVLESAFLAGVVKGPANYDPFVGDPERREANIRRATARTRYVLQRIVDEPAENLVWAGAAREPVAAREKAVANVKSEAQRLLNEGFELPFRRGTFRYDTSAVLDEVARRLAEPPFSDVLAAAGIDDPARAGIEVVTTLDAHLQVEAEYALWHHLTEVGALLESFGPERFVLEGPGPVWDPERRPRVHEVHVARVVAHVGDKPHLQVDLGGTSCTVDRDGVVRAAVAVARGVKGDRGAKASSEEIDAFVAAIPDGAPVLVSVRSIGEGGPVCDLEARPELQGAVVAIEDGQIRALVGGNDNRHFNRTSAMRQMGSTWKTLVLHAAMTVGWSPTDPLDNTRQPFPFSGSVYWPRPDHDPKPTVSLAWAGTTSENVASVWLLFHLLDRLDADRIASLASELDLARRPGEEVPAYRDRIQRAGVMVPPSRVEESRLLRARYEALERGGLSEAETVALRSLTHGWGLREEIKNAAGDRSADGLRRKEALDHTWIRYVEREQACAAAWTALATGGVPKTPLFVRPNDEARVFEVRCEHVPDGDLGWVGWEQLGSLQEERRDDAVPAGGLFRGPRAFGAWGVVPRDQVWLGRLTLGTIATMRTAIERMALIDQINPELSPEPYDPDILYWNQDFRVLLAMRYVAGLAAQLGVRSEIRPVLSMPLGASEVSLEEMTALYEGLTTGNGWTFPGEARSADGRAVGVSSPPAPALLIKELRDVDGNVLYRAEATPRRVTSAAVGAATSDVLRNVVRFGTGTRAEGAVLLDGVAVPLAGKTGTTNDFKNAAFLGVVPALTSDGWDPAAGYAVGVYVGYDDNRPLTHGKARLAGASAALPAWIGVAEGLSRVGSLGEVRSEEAPVWLDPGDVHRIVVDPATGLPTGVPYGEDTTVASSVVPGVPSWEHAPIEPAPTRPVRVRQDGEGGGLWGRRRAGAPGG
jgi:membrane peptidoglycan carboxypeptidase